MTMLERLSVKLDALRWWWRVSQDGTDRAWQAAYRKHGGTKRRRPGMGTFDQALGKRTRGRTDERQRQIRFLAAQHKADETQAAKVVKIRTKA